MAAATSLVFNIIGNNQASSALRDVGGSVDSLSDKVKKWGGLAAAGVGVVAVAAAGFAASAVGAASDLNETMSKSSAIFGAQADDISKWGDTAAKTLGLSKSQAVAAAAGFGDMFTQLGFGGDVAADMSKDVVQMSADLGSFNNLGTDDVADRLSAAFRGEYDSLQALIPNINAARVEQEAMAATGKTNASELTAQEKAAAVLAIVHKDGAKAAGDFEKTSGGLANQQKILSASFQDVKAKIGTALLPILTKVGTFVIDKVLPAFGKLTPIIDKVKTAFSAMSSGFKEGDVTSDGFFGTFEKVGVVIRDVAGWVMNTAVPALRQLWGWIQDHVIPAAVDLAGKIMGGLKSAFDTIKAKIEENKPQLMQLWEWFKTLAAFIYDTVIPIYGTYLKGALEVAGQYIGIVISAIGWLVDAVKAVADATIAAKDWIVAAWQNVSDAVTATKDWIVNAFNNVVDFVGGLPGRITGAASGIWDSITGAVSNAKQWISDRFDDVVGFVTGLPSRIGSAASGMWDGIGNAFKSAINRIIGWWNNLTFPTFKIPSIDIPMLGTIGGGSFGGWDIPNITPLAKGGIVTARPGGMLAQIGEAGHDEAVIPLDGKHGFGGDTYIINFNGPVSRDAEEWVTSMLASALRKGGGTGVRAALAA